MVDIREQITRARTAQVDARALDCAEVVATQTKVLDVLLDRLAVELRGETAAP